MPMIETGQKCDRREQSTKENLELLKNSESVPETLSLLSSINESRAIDLLVSIIEPKALRSWY